MGYEANAFEVGSMAKELLLLRQLGETCIEIANDGLIECPLCSGRDGKHDEDCLVGNYASRYEQP